MGLKPTGDGPEEGIRPADLRNLSPGTRGRILDAAMELFSRRGYARTSIREIVETAGATKPMLYYYYGNKDGLYLETVRSCERRVDRLLEEIARVEVAPKEKIEQFCLGLWLLMQRYTPLFALINEGDFGPVPETAASRTTSVRKRVEAFLHGLVDEGQRAGTFRGLQAEAAVSLLMGVICSTEPCEATRMERSRRLGIFEQSLELVFDGILPQRGAPPENE